MIEEVDRDGRRLIDVGMYLVWSSSCIDGGVFGGDWRRIWPCRRVRPIRIG